MIRYPITRQKLEQLIEAESPGWLADAKGRTDNFRQLGHYEEASSIWSKAKPVYMQLQGESKCAYCERTMESADFGAVEQDVEHFRPKGNVKAWKAPKELTDQGLQFTPALNGGAEGNGAKGCQKGPQPATSTFELRAQFQTALRVSPVRSQNFLRQSD